MEPTEKEKQIAFLKEHEEEMTVYVKSQNDKITSVQYIWESVEIITIGNGLPFRQEKQSQLKENSIIFLTQFLFTIPVLKKQIECQ